MIEIPIYSIEPTPDGQVGWFVKDHRGRIIAHFDYKDDATAAAQEMSGVRFSVPVIDSLLHEPWMYLG